MITIIDYHVGNCGSIQNMLKRIGHNSIITDNPSIIENASKIIIPGVGSFDKGMTNLKELNIIEILNQKVLEEKIPLLGICLGMQLLCNSSDEGELKGLGWINAISKKFEFSSNVMKVPHMGWNKVICNRQHELVNDLTSDNKFYFVHSYYVECLERDDILLSTNYGNLFTSGVQRNNICGFQFHPEKSHKYGMNLLKNFAEFNYVTD